MLLPHCPVLTTSSSPAITIGPVLPLVVVVSEPPPSSLPPPSILCRGEREVVVVLLLLSLPSRALIFPLQLLLPLSLVIITYGRWVVRQAFILVHSASAAN